MTPQSSIPAPSGVKMLGGHLVFLSMVGVLAALLPSTAWDPRTAQFLFVIGTIGMWRYGWGALHLVRSLIYRGWVFPKWRAAANALGDEGMPSHVYLLVTSFRIDGETTRKVYQSVIDEAIACGAPTTIVASIVELGDQRLIKQLFEIARPPAHVRLKLVRIAGTGKRDALAFGFRAIAAENPAKDAVAAVIDGDSIMEPGLVRKCAPFFTMNPRVGALTTDEDCVVEGSWIFREWYSMRFAQRQVQMSSVGLSRRVLTLTGRMSMFRARLLADPDFIRRVEVDYIDHWRLGRIRFLTGDDKSSWYDLLSGGWEMLYIPDVKIMTVEHAPSRHFIEGSLMLMRRWFGNMLRTNTRAIALGPGRMGLFTWICVIDQRISMWTCLTSIVATLLFTIAIGPEILLLYAFWVLATRYLLVLSLLTARRNVSPWWPFLLYYNQIVGSLVKVFMIYHLDRQKWTRQNTSLAKSTDSLAVRIRAASSPLMMAIGFSLFTILLGLGSGVLETPDAALGLLLWEM